MKPNIPKKHFKEKEKRNEAKKSQTILSLNNVVPKISQSLVKELSRYAREEKCGLVLEDEFISKEYIHSASDSKKVHDYFIYKVTGKLPLNGLEPYPIVTKTGKLSVDYERINAQIENLQLLLNRLNFSIEYNAFVFTNPKFGGTADLVVSNNNLKTKDIMKKRAIVSLKTSSLLNDERSDLGWGNVSIQDKEELMLEAIHVKLLAKYEWGIENIPFYYFVFSNKNEWEYKIFKIDVDELKLQSHYQNLLSAKKFLDETIKNGWKAHPKYSVCRTCSLTNVCKSFKDIPEIVSVSINE